MKRLWLALPLLAIAGLLALRAALHVPAFDRLAPVEGRQGDPPGSTARAGSLFVTRGGPVIIGFDSASGASLTIGGKQLRGKGLVKDRLVLPAGPVAIRFAATPGARLMWSPVGRRGDPEYVTASSLSPEPPERATFDAPGTATTDGAIAAAILLVIVGTLLGLVRHRLARVPRPVWLAMGSVLVLALFARLVGLGDQGATWDEDVNWAAGRNYVTNVLSLDASAASWRWNYEHPPVMKLLAGIGAQFADGYGPARALSALWSALACALLVAIGARLFRLRVGVLAGLIGALLPSLVAHGQIVGHESPTVLWWTLGIVLALGVHDELPAAPGRALSLRLAGVGALIGIAVASRFVNGLLGPLCVAIVVLQAAPSSRKAVLARAMTIMPAIAVATFVAVWPRLWSGPIDALRVSLAKLEGLHAVEPFLGTITNQPGAHYFVIYLVVTLPVLVLLAALVGAVHLARVRNAAALILLTWLVVPLVIMASPVRQDGVRYVMPCVLALVMLAAVGIDALAKRVRFEAAAAVMGVYLVVTLARIAPYHLDYFGEHVGGTSTVAARRWFETAWWGEGLDRAIAYVNEHAAPRARIFNGCVLPNHLTWYREDLWATATNDVKQADWVVHYSPGSRHCAIPPGLQKLHEVRAGGAPLALVWGRTQLSQPSAPKPAKSQTP